MVEAQWPPPVTKSAFVSVGSLLGLIAASREHLIRLNELLRWQRFSNISRSRHGAATARTDVWMAVIA